MWSAQPLDSSDPLSESSGTGVNIIGTGLTNLIFTAIQRRSAAGDSSPNAPACRSHRGKAPEGSSLLGPRVEARSAEDRRRECQERYTTPPGCRTYQGVRQPVRHPCGVAVTFVMPDPRVFGATPLDRWLWSEHPQGVLRSPLFIMS